MTDNVTQLPRKPATNAERQAKHRQRKAAAKAAAAAAVTPPAVPAVTSTVMPTAANWQHSGAVAFVALAGALALTSVDAVFGTVGMTAIFPGAVVPVMVMTGVLEGTKIITAAWLARHWRNAPLTLRVPLIGVILALMLLSGIGTHGFLARAHLEPLAVATDAIDREAAPIAQRIAIAASDLRDLDARVVQLDEIIKVATGRGSAKTAMLLLAEQQRSRSDLVAQRRSAAARMADLRVKLAALEGQRVQVSVSLGPSRFLAELLGWGDAESDVKLIILLLVIVIDPAAILLTLAATYRRGAP